MNKLIRWRHRRIWVEPSSIGSIRGLSELPIDERQFLENWIISGKPLVGRAIHPCDETGKNLLPLGLMLHLAGSSKKRLNLQIDSSLILKVDEPLSIKTVMEALPLNIAVKVNSMLSGLADYPIQIKVFGSVFWSYEGKQNYMTENSDIDLLISFTQNCNLSTLSKTLCHLSNEIDLRLDGEFEFINGNSVSWREFASKATKLLVKTDSGPKLMARHRMMEEFNVL